MAHHRGGVDLRLVVLLMRSQIACWIGIIASAFMIITAFWWIPYYPVWSFVYVLIGVLVIYGLLCLWRPRPLRQRR